MRIKVEMTDLTPEQWSTAQRLLRTSYDIPERADRMCLTLVHGDEERHVETPAGVLPALSMSMAMFTLRTTLANAFKIAPVDQFNEALGEPCQHGSPVVKADPSAFADAPPVRTHEDGCQSYGPYTNGPDA